MKLKRCVIAILALSASQVGNAGQLEQQVEKLTRQNEQIQRELIRLKAQIARKNAKASKSTNKGIKKDSKAKSLSKHGYHDASVSVHSLDVHPESPSFYPSVLMAENQPLAVIAGTPVVTSPYLGERPAFDGSDLIVNISSINQDLRLMQQRRRLFKAFEHLGYDTPHMPIIALSGALEPFVYYNSPYMNNSSGDIDLGTAELDVAIALNEWVEGLISVGYDNSVSAGSAQRLANSNFYLNKGFVNVGNLDKTPFYATAGQIYVPFGRYSSSMVSSNLPLLLGRTKARPFIFGYKNPHGPGLYAAVYGFRSDTNLGRSGVGGVNAGLTFEKYKHVGEIGVSFISNIADSNGMQSNGSAPGTVFGGFSSLTNGNEMIKKVPGFDAHFNWSRDAFNVTAEWVTATERFRTMDLSFNGRGAKPQAANIEGAYTFTAFEKPASVGVGYQWSKEALALRLPRQRINGVFNISIWPNTVQSIEYRHDIDYKTNQFANGANSTLPMTVANVNTVGTGRSSDTVTAQMGMYF